MERGFDMNDDILVKYLAGEASSGEKEIVEGWLRKDEENRRYFGHFQTIWQESEALADTSNADENAAWDRFREKVIRKPETQPKVRLLSPWLRIAAAVLLLCIGGAVAISLFLNTREAKIVQVQSIENTVTDTLPDGTVITLNRNSKLGYPSRFAGSRNVKMEGEVFFDVTPDSHKPFIIEVNDVTVTVVGTSFNVKSRNGKTEVIVKTGVVQVSRGHDKVEVKPGEKVVAQEDASFYKGINTSTVYDAYTNKTFICRNTPLPELIEAINNVYNTEIQIANRDLEKVNINTTFREKPLQTILDVLRDTYHIKIEQQGNLILFK